MWAPPHDQLVPRSRTMAEADQLNNSLGGGGGGWHSSLARPSVHLRRGDTDNFEGAIVGSWHLWVWDAQIPATTANQRKICTLPRTHLAPRREYSSTRIPSALVASSHSLHVGCFQSVNMPSSLYQAPLWAVCGGPSMG